MGLRDSRSTKRPLMTPVRPCPALVVGHADHAPSARPNVSVRKARGRRNLPAMGRVTRWDVSLGIVRPGGMLGKATDPSGVSHFWDSRAAISQHLPRAPEGS